MSELRFAVTSFQRVFDTEPNRDVIGLERLASSLTRFVVKPKTKVQVERAERLLDAAWQAWQAGERHSGRAWSRLSRAHRQAEQAGEDSEAAARQEYEHLRKEALGAPKRDLRLWSPTLYPANSKRGSDNVLHLSCLVLDYDSGIPINEAAAVWEEYFHIVHTTWSHSREHAKFRLILPLAEPVLPADWYPVYEWAQQRTGMAVDPTGKSLGSTFALPAVANAEHPRVAFSRPGPLLDVVLEGLAQQAAPAAAGDISPYEPSHFRNDLAGVETLAGSNSAGSNSAGSNSAGSSTELPADDPWQDENFPWSD